MYIFTHVLHVNKGRCSICRSKRHTLMDLKHINEFTKFTRLVRYLASHLGNADGRLGAWNVTLPESTSWRSAGGDALGANVVGSDMSWCQFVGKCVGNDAGWRMMMLPIVGDTRYDGTRPFVWPLLALWWWLPSSPMMTLLLVDDRSNSPKQWCWDWWCCCSICNQHGDINTSFPVAHGNTITEMGKYGRKSPTNIAKMSIPSPQWYFQNDLASEHILFGNVLMSAMMRKEGRNKHQTMLYPQSCSESAVA